MQRHSMGARTAGDMRMLSSMFARTMITPASEAKVA
jgi:hypothetical protein